MLTENVSDAFTDPTPKRGRGRPKKEDSDKPDSADKPPKNRSPQPPSVKGWSRAVEIENIIFKYLSGVSLAVSFLSADDAQIIQNGAADLAHELVELGKVDKRFRSVLESLAAPGKYGGLLIASGSIIIPIAMNHNLIPSFDLGSLTKNSVPFVNSDMKEGDNLNG